MRVSETVLPAGMVVVALTGRDRGRWLLVVAPQQGTAVSMADGVTRRVESPKSKNVKHVRGIGVPDDAPETLRLVRDSGDAGVKNAIVRACLARYRQQIESNA